MRVLIALDNHFFRTPDGRIWNEGVCGYPFWERYATVFSQVAVAARIRDVNKAAASWLPADGPGVTFHPLPHYLGPWQFCSVRTSLRHQLRQALLQADCAILRVPGTIASLAWTDAQRIGLPVALEVCGDPWDALAPGMVKSIVRPLARVKAMMDLKRQCREADVVAYVTSEYLQRRYPAKRAGYCADVSDVELPAGAFAESVNVRWQSDECLKLIHVGSMATFYKAQDVQLKALRKLRDAGLNCRLTLIGDGENRGAFERLTTELDLSDCVEFAGNVSSGAAVRQKLDEADIFLLPSYVEALPRALIEAMARGLPCIASDVGGISELIDADMLVAAGDIDALADKIKELATPQRMQAAAMKNLQKAQSYRLELLKEKRLKVYEELLRNCMKGNSDEKSVICR